MQTITTIGLDIAKAVFQVHGIDAEGKVLMTPTSAHMAEFGIVAPVGRKGVEQLLAVVTDARDQRVPELARACLAALGGTCQPGAVHTWHAADSLSRLGARPLLGVRRTLPVTT